MLDLRPVLLIVGLLLSTVAVAMLIPAAVDLGFDNEDWQVFVTSSALTLFMGLSLILTNHGSNKRLSLREMFLLTVLAWLVIAGAGALPFVFATGTGCIAPMSITDAFFESMSGITTTGSTVIVGLDCLPPGLLMWRALLQWMGGIGIIVMAMAVLPALQVGGMQLFRMESSDKSDKALPRAAQNAGGVALIYLILTALCGFAYWLGGMNWFDAIAHSMTTLATGGFSTSDGSLGNWSQPAIHWVAIVFMLLGGLPFILFLRTVRGFYSRSGRGERGALLRDSQVRWYFAIMASAIVALIIDLRLDIPAEISIEETVRHVAFNVVSIMTGTGYATQDYGLWSAFAMASFFFIMFVGGCAGSTSCGAKVFRFQVLYATARVQIARLLQPHGVFLPYYNGRPISDDVAGSVMGFFFLYIMGFGALALGLAATGLDFETSLSASATAIANVGPGLGEMVGPASTFKAIPDAAKWIMSFGMLLGRLELFTILVLFTPQFWLR